MKKLLLLLLIAGTSTSFNSKPILWVAIGDSITYLNEHANETGKRVTKGYLTRVVEKMPGVQYLNQGHNGWTSADVAEKIETLGLVKADVYTLFLGTNDWWQGRPLGTMDDFQLNTGNGSVYGSFRIIINKLRSLNNKAKIILITPMQRADFVYFNNFKNNAWGSYKEKNGQSLEKFANVVLDIALLEKLPVVDLYHDSGMELPQLVKFKRLKDPLTGVYKNYPYPNYIDIPFNPETDEYPYPAEAIDMTYDGLHPSDKGNEIIANMLLKVM
jgi:lysophospholipase L1-like esterase